MENKMKFCTYCGQQMSAEEEFCPKCGQAVSVPKVYATNSNNNQQASNQAYATNAPREPEQVYTTNAPVAPEAAEFVSTPSATVSEIPSAVPTAKKPETAKSKKKIGLLIGIIAAAVVIIGAACAFILPNIFGGDGETYVTPDGKKLILDDGTYIMEMYPDAECSEDDLADMAEIIEARVKILGEDFEISSDEEKIVLEINKSMLGSTLEERSHNIKLLESNGTQAMMMGGTYTSFELISRDDIKSVELKQVDKDDFVKKNKDKFSEGNIEAFKSIPAGNINVIYVTVTAECGAKIEEESKDAYEYENTLVCATDCVKSSDYELVSQNKFADIIPVKGKEGKEFYIVSPQAQSKANAELILSILENKGFERGLEVNLIAEPEWETESTSMGKNQEASIDGDAVTYEWTPSDYTLSYMSAEEYEEYLDKVKARIDALNTPYAIGYKGVDMSTIVLKISPEKMSADFGRMIFGTSDVQLFTQFKDMDAYVREMEVLDDHNGAPALQVTFSESKAELFEGYSMTRSDALDLAIDRMGSEEEEKEVVDDGEAKPVYLVINDVNVASADLSNMTDDSVLIFENFLFTGDDKLTSDDTDVLNFIATASDDYVYIALDSDADMDIQINHYDGDKLIDDEIEWGYDAKNDYDNEMIKKVADMGYEMSFSPSRRNTPVIEIDVAVDENLPANFCEAVKKVYQECNFADGAYAGVIFKVKDETKKHPGDRCRIVFSKDSYDKVKLTYLKYVEGPRFSEYSYDFYKVMDEDEFFVENARY